MAARRILTLIALCAITIPVPGFGSPRSDPTTGRAVFTGATTPHATSISLAPAALGLGSTAEVYIGLTSVLTQLGIDTRTFDPDTGALSPGVGVTETIVSPGASLAFIGHPSDRITLGFEAKLPPSERFAENRQALRYHTLGGHQHNFLLTLGLSFKVTSKIYFGTSLSTDNTFLRLQYARDTALEAGRPGIDADCGGARCGVGNPAATELYDVRVRSEWVSTQNLKLNLGTVIQIASGVWLGVTYHTPPGFDIQSRLEGDVRVIRAPRDGSAVVSGRATVFVSYPASLDAEIRARLPAELDLHVGGRWEDLSRMTAYDVRAYGADRTTEISLRDLGIPEWTLRPRGLDDTFSVWAGVEQIDTGEPLRVGGRLGVETASVRDSRTTAVTVAPMSFTADLGAQFRVVQNWVVQTSYGLQYAPEVSVAASSFDPQARIDCVANGFDYSTGACAKVRGGYAIDTAAGNYRKLDHALRVGVRYDW
ncbi:MAG: hypothetical protein AB7O24_09165 [Kofleriaceae bacterium]